MLFSVWMSLCQMSQRFALALLLCFSICTSLANAACIDVKQTKSVSFEGTLSTGRCNGESVVRTIKTNGMNLIESIRTIGDC